MHGLTEVCVIAGDRRFDLALPSGRPVVEYVVDLVVTTGRWGGEPRRWCLRPVGWADPLPALGTLDEAGVRDGAVLVLEPEPFPTAGGDGMVDNLAGAVADAVVARRAPAPDRDAVSTILALAGVAALIAPAVLTPALGPVGGVASAAAVLVLALLAAGAPRPPVAGVAAAGAVVHAAVSAWASSDAVTVGARVAFALVAAGGVACALATFVDRAGERALLAGTGAAAVVGAAVAGGGTLAGWPPDLTGLVALVTGLVLLAGAEQAGFRVAGVPRLDRGRPTGGVVRRRVEVGRQLVSAAHLAAALVVAGGSALVFAGDDPRRWVAAGLVAVVVVVRARACRELAQLVPLVVGTAFVVVAFAALVVGPHLGWVAVYVMGAAVGVVLCTLARWRPVLRPLVRRRLGHAELVLAAACVPVVLLAADVLAAALALGRGAM